ncbi:Metalloendopeptidase [Operophtera brumata]|uniref:Metalloendopeptidase n=1 Tax=Operophtera brumata TaxID=104452 RepID=A0A0L7KRP6_OPEBR|nr:Metalloendopeptidase [Operophtera brumata]
MKLRVWFGHECNKRNIGALLEICKNVFLRHQLGLVDHSATHESEGAYEYDNKYNMTDYNY